MDNMTMKQYQQEMEDIFKELEKMEKAISDFKKVAIDRAEHLNDLIK